MGVFNNIYYPNYEKAIKEIETQKEKYDTTFDIIYFDSVISTFRWGGDLPKNMPYFEHEKMLETAGRTGAFERNGKFYLLPAFPSGTITEYGEFSEYICISRDGKNYNVKADDIEICFNNSLKLPLYFVVKEFADKASLALRAVYTSLNRAIQPPIIACSSEEEMKKLDSLRSAENLMMNYIIINKEKFSQGDTQRLPIFDNRESDVLALWDVYVRQRNLFYSTFGVNNVEIQKRERLTEAEGSGNDEIVRYSLLNDMYQNRKDFIERVKNHFNKNITCDIERDATTVYHLNSTNKEKIDLFNVESTKGANINEKEVKVNEDSVE